MVNDSTRKLVARYKVAFAWSGVGDDLHITVGEWTVRVKMTVGAHDIHRYYVAVQTPEGKKLKAPGGDYRTQDQAKREADIWVKDLKNNGSISLAGWKTDD